MTKTLIQGYPDFVKDENTNAILNTNKTALDVYKAQKQRMINLNNKVNILENEISLMNNKISEMQNILTLIYEKVSK